MAEFKIGAWVTMTLESENGDQKSEFKYLEFNLELGENVKESIYLDSGGHPTKDGSKALTICFINALVGNIHACQKEGFWKEADHIRYIIEKLQEGYVRSAEVYKQV